MPKFLEQKLKVVQKTYLQQKNKEKMLQYISGKILTNFKKPKKYVNVNGLYSNWNTDSSK